MKIQENPFYMKFKNLLLTALPLLLAIMIPNTANAQFLEDFEQGSKASYAAGNVDLASGTWFLNDALLGSADGDRKNGGQSARVRGEIRMQFNSPNGADEFSFYASNSGFSGDTGGELQVYYSSDNGTNWVAVGEPILVTATLSLYTIPVGVQGDIRFRIQKTAGNRVSIDDVRITDFIQAEQEATLDVFVDGELLSDSSTFTVPSTLVGTQRTLSLELRNRGNESLTISDLGIISQAFEISALSATTLAFSEKATATITFAPTQEGFISSDVTVTSNAANTPNFTFTLEGEAFADGNIIPISEARNQGFNNRVTVTGRVTVANELGGPLYMQDATAGIAVFYEPLHTTVEIGDSITVSGPLTEFNPITGSVPGTFLLQIAPVSGDQVVTFEVINTEKRIPEPKEITILQMNQGGFEGELVQINNVTIDFAGAFNSNTNYNFSDVTASGQFRIDNNTNLVGASAPSGTINVSGVVGRFNDVYQFIPRFTEDLGVEAVEIPGEDVSKDQTLDVVTWNIEFFGSGNGGPSDINLQLENVKTVVTTIDADIYALQEVSSTATFNQLVADLADYGGFISNYNQTQQTAFLFKRSTIDYLSSGVISQGFTQQFWANGRYPLFFQFNATINGESQDIYAFNIHAKALGDATSYNQRLVASGEMKDYLDRDHPDDNVIFLGDFNDEINQSTYNGEVSPYDNFFQDPEYTIVTKSLEDRGLASQSFGSFIDHIVFTSELSDEYFEGTERVENPFYIGSYLSTTSDHFPIWTRFKFGTITNTENEFFSKPTDITLSQNYPNPFNPTTTISYTLNESMRVNLEVFDMLGRKVATLVDGNQSAGQQQVSFDATNFASGVYLYRLTTANGTQLIRKMTLLK